MTQDELKRRAAHAALQFVQSGAVIGVGTGSTVNFFIAELAKQASKVRGAVSSSEASARRLRDAGIALVDLNDTYEAARSPARKSSPPWRAGSYVSPTKPNTSRPSANFPCRSK
jgi:NADPH:quinone reductase-like Zn-dependent oxidoreductase